MKELNIYNFKEQFKKNRKRTYKFSLLLNSIILIFVIYYLLIKDYNIYTIFILLLVSISVLFVIAKIVLVQKDIILDKYWGVTSLCNFLFDTGDLLTNIYKSRSSLFGNKRLTISQNVVSLVNDFERLQVNQQVFDSVFADKNKVLRRYNLNIVQITFFFILSFAFSISFFLVLFFLEEVYTDFSFFYVFFLLKGISVGGFYLHLKMRHLKSILYEEDFLGYIIYYDFMLKGLYRNAYIIIPHLNRFINKNAKIINTITISCNNKILSID